MGLPEQRLRAAEHAVAPVPPATPHGATMSWPALALALGAGALLAVRLDVPAFFDNEGRYAEVAREMVLSGDWVSPQLDFTLFLNKPPLTYWLAALVLQIAGPTEWARLVSIVAAIVTLYATARIGLLLRATLGASGGLVAALALATTIGFALEARTLRPDLVVIAAVTVAILCWQHAVAASPHRIGWLVGLWAALGVGVLTKGMVVPVVAAIPIGIVTLRDRGWRGLVALRPGLGLLVFAAVVLPWHVLVAREHPGFAWDYVVNQHLLFFLDKKLPRDSVGDSLPFFWGAFLARTFPWSILLPLTAGEAWRGRRSDASPAARETFFLWIWIAGTMGLFSLATSRLEHYSLPALPAVALLAARAIERGRRGELGAGAWRWLGAIGGAAAVVALIGLVAGPHLLGRVYWVAQQPVFLGLVRPAAVTVLAAGVLLVVAAARRWPGLALGALAVGSVPLVAIVLRALVAAEGLFSWRPVADAITARVPADVEVVFESPQEYQLVGGLVYYTERRITLLEPPGFVPPTYLAAQVGAMFLPRAEFERRWRAGQRLAFVSDPEKRRDEPQGLVPEPFQTIGRFGDRWVLATVSVGR